MKAGEIGRWMIGAMFATVWLSVGWMRVLNDQLPQDLAAYVAAADLFAAGANPYDPRAIVAAERNQGFLFIYPPMSLWLIWPLSKLATSAIIVIELLARLGALAFIALTLKRRFWPGAHLLDAMGLLFVLVLARIDFEVGNMGTPLCALWLAVVAWPEERERRAGPAALLGYAAAGFLFACKPLWVPVACAGLVARRRYAAFAALAAGAGAMIAASMAQRELWQGWLDVLAFHQAYYGTRDIMVGQPLWSVGLVALCWLGAALWLLRREREVGPLAPPIWIWAGVGVVAWPRLGLYDLLLLLPALCWLATRGRAWLVAALAIIIPQALEWLHYRELHMLTQVFFTMKLVSVAFAGVVFAALLRAMDEAERAA